MKNTLITILYDTKKDAKMRLFFVIILIFNYNLEIISSIT